MDWFDRVPKVEIHVHLEGAIPHAALWELIRKYGGDEAIPDLIALKRLFEYRDFQHFIRVWSWKNRFIREYADFTFIAEAVAQDWASQNIRYVESFFSPSDFAELGLRTQKITEAIRAGLSRVPSVQVQLVADLVRDYGPESASNTLLEVREVRDLGVIGIGIGGSEEQFPPELFEKVFERARNLGFRTSAHAGEAAGAESVWGAIRSLRVDRIGHGTRAVEDDSLVEFLAKKEIPLETCPISNFRTGVVQSLARHPIRRYFDQGLVVTVNSDDPTMFGTSLAQEFRALEADLGFSHEEIRTLILQGLQSAWLPRESREQLIETFRRDPSWAD